MIATADAASLCSCSHARRLSLARKWQELRTIEVSLMGVSSSITTPLLSSTKSEARRAQWKNCESVLLATSSPGEEMRQC